MPLTSIRVNTYHCGKAYRNAVFVPSITESDKVDEDAAEFLTNSYRDQTLTKYPGMSLIFSNVYGAFYAYKGTEVVEVGWNSRECLNDTPLPISQGTFNYMLEVLPPKNWRGVNDKSGWEMFQMIEHQTGEITGTMIRHGKVYWAIHALNRESMDQIRARLDAGLRTLADLNWPTALDKPPQRMLCSCCGGVTLGRQWYNRDTGYGLCPSCVDAHDKHGSDVVELMDLHGFPGIHFMCQDLKPVPADSLRGESL